MTLRHLRIFVTVCETGSMTAAAQILYIAQPAISLAVSEMEEHYKVRLFDRISRRLYLTDSGRQALEYARHIIALFDEMEQGVRGGQAAKELRIGTSITIGSCLLPGYIRALKEHFPTLTVQAAVGNSGTIEQKLLENTIDIGIIEGMVHSPYIHCQTFPGAPPGIYLFSVPSICRAHIRIGRGTGRSGADLTGAGQCGQRGVRRDSGCRRNFRKALMGERQQCGGVGRGKGRPGPVASSLLSGSGQP